MKKIRCQSIAKNTQQQCEKLSLLGESYCWLHYPKKEAVELFVLGILLTFLVQTAYDHFTVSTEEEMIQELIRGKNTLFKQNQALNAKVENYQKDLNAKEEKIKELQTEVGKARRGISKGYDFWGNMREGSASQLSFKVGGLKKIVNQMISLQEQTNWKKLILLCNDQIKQHPEWLTPYVFMSVAYANQGNTGKAIELLEFVKKKAPDDPEYEKARKLLQELKNQKY